ncbi:peptidoglycan L-alanyl-D-glutamate endopeptidase CwlK [Pedobacter sp. AK013]|uniref:M15 family metallopeptidase n=1 Tax=Pedobacter sp. AK013 TaxID=2723071 RepID=UPI0016152C52|nr:M15 family metallopeptidase [Pedobacter sp. AK013]MBB6236478.1 peptidoglycan L-alanyl-D-glutamate endopeptidase CwlK [Pedobacter sp. AK013]
MAILGKRSVQNLVGVHPNLVKVIKTAIVNTPYDFTVVEGVRTQARQMMLYAQGRTAKGDIVTFADGVKNKSNHQVKSDGYGHAVDIYPYINGKVDFNNAIALKTIASHIKSVAKQLNIGITWGGDWKKPFDPPHFQLK